jgi:23S rRNA pseudouridine2605 synthase
MLARGGSGTVRKSRDRALTQQRLQKVLASRGIASRRGAERLIADGLVTVNGVTASLGQAVDPSRDDIRVSGEPVPVVDTRLYLALHKPEGFITSTAGEPGQKTVMELIDADERLYPVGRLDRDSAGLLLFTNDGEWANLVIHPRYEIDKEYVAVVRGHPSNQVLDVLRTGIRLPTGESTSSCLVEALHRTETTTALRIVVHEGKKRQIRLMMAAVGHPVLRLTRVRIGPVRLGDLKKGAWRVLADEEVAAMRSCAGVENSEAHI